MESALDTEPKGIDLLRLAIQRDRKGAVFVKFSYTGMKIPIVLVVGSNLGPNRFRE